MSTVLTQEMEKLLGATFIVETDPAVASANLLEVIDRKRAALGLQ